MAESSGQQLDVPNKLSASLLESQNGYESSNDDHFSDAHENPGEQISSPSDVLPEATGSSIAEPTPEPPVTTSPAETDSPIIVKWNEKQDKIRPKVKGEKQRIERLVQQHRDRSTSPSVSPSSRRKVSGAGPPLESDTFSDIHSPSDGPSPCPSPRFAKGSLSPANSRPSSRPRSPVQPSPNPLSLPTPLGLDDISVQLPTEIMGQVTATTNKIKELEETLAVSSEEASKETLDMDVEERSSEAVVENTADAFDFGPEKTTDDARAENADKEESDIVGVESGHKEENDGFGGDDFGDDDFDDFGETTEGNFDDFDGFEEAAPTASFPSTENVQPEPQMQSIPSIPEIPVSILDFRVENELDNALLNAMEKMFPSGSEQKQEPSTVDGRPFLTERSHSLWNQLCAPPPPLQPPNWKVSRIRRLFLVSLGVPVDLDEILPAETKQKKLVLPSVHLDRKSMDSRSSSPNGNSRSQPGTGSKENDGDKSKGKPGALDFSSARILCSTSDVALSHFTVEELQEHIRQLKEMTQTAGENLTYWLQKRNSAQGDKEMFETVIESLVGYARKKRQNG